jgi:uncharacterized membrane protein
MQKNTVNTSTRNKSYHKIEKEDLSEVNKIYQLYMTGWLTMYITNIVGYKMAFTKRNKPENSIIANSHYKYQVKIMNINFLLTLVCMLGSTAYISYVVSQIDFMNLELTEKSLEGLAASSTLMLILGLLPSIVITIQSFIGMKKAKNYQQI